MPSALKSQRRNLATQRLHFIFIFIFMFIFICILIFISTCIFIFIFHLYVYLCLYRYLYVIVCLSPGYTVIALVTMALYRILSKFIALGSCEPDAAVRCAAPRADVVLGQHLL